MSDKATMNRQRIIEVANQLFYFRGFNQTSFTDIAEAAEIPRGNFYYYFKSKDEILSAVIEQRLEEIKTQLSNWQEDSSPLERLRRFVNMLRAEAGNLILYGCPMGSLNMELGKTQPELKVLAIQMFDLYKNWLAKQFTEMGYIVSPDDYAIQLLIRAQGMAVLAHTYHDSSIIDQEADRMLLWVAKLAKN